MDFRFDQRRLLLGGPARRAELNVRAIELLKQNEQFSEAQQWEMAHYSGWGCSAVAKKINLAGLTPEERASAGASSLNAFYTSQDVLEGIWQGLAIAGLKDVGVVLDPSAGVGQFKSSAPDDVHAAQWVEIELDLVTGGILNKLHPSSKVLVTGFEKADLPDDSFDLVISNFPFGNYGIADSRFKHHPIMRASVHNYFFARSLQVVKPGGLVVGITSRYTMDGRDSEVRRYLAEKAELLAAVRLPGGNSGAFHDNAGTDVTTDILVLRKRPGAVEVGDGEDWVFSEPKTMSYQEKGWNDRPYTRETTVYTNMYYQLHPEYVLGRESLDGTMYSDHEYLVEGQGQDLGEPVSVALADQLAGYSPLIVPQKKVVPMGQKKECGNVTTLRESEDPRILAMVEIFTTAKELMRFDTDSPLAAIPARSRLNRLYTEFTGKYGRLRNSVSRLPPGSPEAPFLLALERKDGTKALLFEQSVVRTMARIENPTVQEAYVMCLNKLGRVDISVIAATVGLSNTEVVDQLNGLVYQDKPGHYVTAETYLSGDVKTKLAEAKGFATLDPSFEANVAALEKVQPVDKGPGEIAVRLGAPWIKPEYIKQFISDLIRLNVTVTVNGYQNRWRIEYDKWSYDNDNNANTATWGTHRYSAIALIESSCNGKLIAVYDIDSDDKKILNQAETIAAQQKAEDIKTRFLAWCWEDDDRRNDLVATYNEKLNRVVECQYNGDHLTIPGLSQAFEPYDSQRAGVWRALQQRATLLDHEIGIGKTLTGIMAAMEAIRMGLARKALIVVPNKLVAQWQDVVLAAYPGCNVLAATKDTLTKNKRPEWMATVATNAWDIVICPFSSFKLLNVRPSTLIQHIEREVAEVKMYLQELKGNKQSSREEKNLERTLKRLEAKLENLFEDVERDDRDTITFEELGIDMLIVDEIHEFKKLEFHTKMGRIAGLGAGKGSQRAFDMYVKASWLLERAGRFVGMTGTPLTNTMAEVYTWQRFFGREALEEAGLRHFDSWFATFAVAEPALEMTPDGSGFRMHTRVRKFVNVKALSAMWSQFCDHRVIEKGGMIERPDQFLDRAVKVTSDGGPELREAIQSLARRAEAISGGGVDPRDDNMLAITTDGRKWAIKPKLPKLCEQIVRIYKLTTPVKGTQVVFLDLGTPKAKRKEAVEDDALYAADAYYDIRDMLIAQGIPGHEIAFIHTAKNNAALAKIYQAVNDGQIRVLLGSTGKMGVGMNVQKRLVALHQVDPTWRPDQMEQRLGRMVRQGNLWPTVVEFIHITAGSFDGYMWQTLETKMLFKKQFSNGAGVDEVEDISETVLSYADIKGTASGNPKVMERVTCSIQVQKLDGLRQAHQNAKWRARSREAHAESSLRWTRKKIARLEELIAQAQEQDKFSVTLGDKVYDNRNGAGHKTRGIMTTAMPNEAFGSYRGIDLIKEEVAQGILIYGEKYINTVELSPAGIWQSIDHYIRQLPTNLAEAKAKIPVLEQTIKDAKAQQVAPFQFADEFEAEKIRLAQLDRELNADAKKTAEDAEAGLVAANKLEIDDTDLNAAMVLIEQMMQDPAVLARFEVKPALPALPKPAPKISKPTRKKAFTQPSLPGFKMIEVVKKPRKKRGVAATSKVIQTGFVFG